MVELGIGQEDCLNWGVAWNGARRKPGKGLNLLTNVRAGIDQVPALTVSTDGERRLGPRRSAKRSRPQAAAVSTVAVPLREAATGCGP